MGIKIGNNNKISNSTIANTVNKHQESPKKSWYGKHPIIGGIFVSLLSGILLIFMKDAIEFIKEIF